MTSAIEAEGLGRRYGRQWALLNCTLSIPSGRVVGLVGSNGAGKTTLLHLVVGLLEPSCGTMVVLDGPPGLASRRVGFLAQDLPVYPRLTVEQHLRMGDWLNPSWDRDFAVDRIEELGLAPRQRAGTLSGGQRAQLSLTMALAKRPELLVLDEPLASLDPLARREFLQTLMEVVAARGVTVLLSSHLIGDIERVCDYLILLVSGRVALSGEVDDLLSSHRQLTGPRRDEGSLPATQKIVESSHVDRQSTLLVHSDQPILDPAWTITPVTLDDLVLAYMRQARDTAARTAPGGLPMIRFAWLQARAQTLTGAAAATAVVVIAAITGLEVSHLYNSVVTHCQTVGDCPAATARYVSQQHFLQNAFPFLLRVTPALLGIFYGAPLCAREFETGTFRLAWTQSVSRQRWLITKLAIGLAATVVVAGIAALAVTWWSRGFDILSANQYANFDERDIAPIGYAAFAFTLGALAGAIVRRLLPAMAVSLAGFVAVRLAVTAWLRPHLIAPVRTLVALSSAPSFEIRGTKDGPVLTGVTVQAPNMPNAWVQSVKLVTNSGHAPTLAQETAFIKQYCLPIAQPAQPASGVRGGPVQGSGNPTTLANCQTQAEHLFRIAVNYQPPSRYWIFQWSELGIFMALAVAAGIGCYWWITRRAC